MAWDPWSCISLFDPFLQVAPTLIVTKERDQILIVQTRFKIGRKTGIRSVETIASFFLECREHLGVTFLFFFEGLFSGTSAKTAAARSRVVSVTPSEIEVASTGKNKLVVEFL